MDFSDGSRSIACATLLRASLDYYPSRLVMQQSMLFTCCAFTLFMSATTFAADDAYPQRPIRLIIPQSPGGASDTVGRIVAQKLSERLGHQLVADNRPGATGNIGAELVAHAWPD